jgi:4-hydroxythreonine-4-phosphate dehydrogenase
MKSHLNPLWISEGDPTGISYELLEKSYENLLQLSQNRSIFLVRSQKNFIPKFFSEHSLPSKLPKSGLYYINSKYFNQFKDHSFVLGNPGIKSGLCSYLSLKYTCKLIKKYGGDLITLPLSKEWVLKCNNIKFSGHTEFLADYFNTNTYMVMYSKEWKVLVLTTHIPLKDVVRKLKKISWKKLFSAIQKSKFFPNPKIGFCGINPHAGEGGKIGREEGVILSPILKRYSRKKFLLQGPFSADSIFTEEWKGRFDLILACYHDQGLAPFKALVGKKGINLTIGLPFTRVSPDHGPAFEIAGKMVADPSSLKNCIEFIGSIASAESLG